MPPGKPKSKRKLAHSNALPARNRVANRQDRVLTLPNSGKIQIVESMQTAGGPPPSWALALKAELGMPDNAKWRRWELEGACLGSAMASIPSKKKGIHAKSLEKMQERWRHYHVELFGMLIDPPSGKDYPWPFYRYDPTDANETGEVVQLWRQRVTHASSPVYCEVLWHPERGRTISLKGLERTNIRGDVALAWEGLKLLQKGVNQGRPIGSKSLTKDQFRGQAPIACRSWMERFFEWPTDGQLAQELLISTTTLYTYMRDYGLNMRQIRDLAT